VRAISNEIGRIRDQNTNYDLDRPIVHPPLKPRDYTSDCQANQNAASGQEEQSSGAFYDGWRVSCDQHCQSKLQCEQSGPIVHQALGFQNFCDPLWQADSSRD
jgi:hypothetical protein